MAIVVFAIAIAYFQRAPTVYELILSPDKRVYALQTL